VNAAIPMRVPGGAPRSRPSGKVEVKVEVEARNEHRSELQPTTYGQRGTLSVGSGHVPPSAAARQEFPCLPKSPVRLPAHSWLLRCVP
jgi:hypothetical protein